MPWWKVSQHIEIFSLWLETPQNPSQPWLPRPLPGLLTSPGHSHFRFDACPLRGIQEPAPGHGCHPFWRVRAMPHHCWTFLISPWERYIFHFFLLANWVSIAFEGTQKSPHHLHHLATSLGCWQIPGLSVENLLTPLNFHCSVMPVLHLSSCSHTGQATADSPWLWSKLWISLFQPH